MTVILDQDLDRVARKRAGAKLGFYIHAVVFILVNLMLAGLAASQGRNWAVFPAFGWLFGLVMHGAFVFLFSTDSSLHSRMVQRERERLATQRDPW